MSPVNVATLGASSFAEFKTANSVVPEVSVILAAVETASVLLKVALPATRAIVVPVNAFLNIVSPVPVNVVALLLQRM